MQQKIVRLLTRPLFGTKNPERQLFKFLPWFAFAFIKFLRWTTLGLLGVLILWIVVGKVWIVVGNLMASQQEKEIEQDLKEFAKQFPKTGPNDSALKLRALVAKPGMGFSGTNEFPIDAYSLYHPDFDYSDTDSKAFDDIRELLGEYLDNQLAKPNNEIDTPPEELLNYLESQAGDIEAIRDHVLQNEAPQWEIDITPILEGNYNNFISPSLLNLDNLQKILVLSILEKTRKGDNQEALEMLKVSWKINQYLRKRPDLSSQISASVIGKYMTGVMRKIDNLPAEWLEHLLKHDYRTSSLKSLKGRIFQDFNVRQNDAFSIYLFQELFYILPDITEYLPLFPQAIRTYMRLSAINIYQIEMQAFSKVYEQNVCLYKSLKIDNHLAWWNADRAYVLYFLKQQRNANQYMLDLEFAQKILQVKKLATKTGKWPKLVPDMESSICPGFQWLYQVDDGTMSISLSQQPEWLLERIKDNDRLPLTYSDRTPPPKKQTASKTSQN